MAALQRSIRSILSRAYSPKHLLATNTATFVSLLGLGDYIQQRFQGVEWDWRRTVRFASIGLILGPMNHYWYKFLDSRMAGRTLKEALKKAAVDFCVSPMFAISFIGGVAVLEGKSPKEALREYRSKFLHVLALDLCVWPPTQTINFLFVPKSARLLYISTVMLFYNTIVSYIKHREIEMYHDMYQPLNTPNSRVRVIGELPKGVTALRFNYFGTHLAAGTLDGDVHILSSGMMHMMRSWRAHTGPIMNISWTHCGRFLLSQTNVEAAYWTVEDGVPIIRICATPGKKLIFAYVNPKNPEQLMYVQQGEPEISLINAETRIITHMERRSKHVVLAHCGTYDQEGEYVITGGANGRIAIYDVRNNELMGVKRIATKGTITSIRHHWRGHKIVLVAGKVIYVYSLDELVAKARSEDRLVEEFRCNDNSVLWSCAVLSPSADFLLGTTQHSTNLFIWSVFDEVQIDTGLSGTGDIYAVDWHPLEAKVVFRGGINRLAYYVDYDKNAQEHRRTPPPGMRRYMDSNEDWLESEWEHDGGVLDLENEEEEVDNTPTPPMHLPTNYPGAINGILPNSIRWNDSYLYMLIAKTPEEERAIRITRTETKGAPPVVLPSPTSIKQEPGELPSSTSIKQEPDELPSSTSIKQEPGEMPSSTSIKQEPGELHIKEEPKEKIEDETFGAPVTIKEEPSEVEN